MNRLPLAARVYVITVVSLGLAWLGVSAVFAQVDDPARFLLFLLLSCLASAIKVTVPVPRAQGRQVMTMSLSFMMNFAALQVIGVHEATLIAAAGAWSQSTFNVRQKNPLYRTLFNICGVAISVAATGWMYTYSGGSAEASLMTPEELMALAAAAATHFLINSGLVAGAISLAAKQSFAKMWSDYFVSGWLNQLLGAATAVVLARGIHQTRFWLVPVTSLFVYLTYRTYRTYHAKLEAEQQAVQQVSDLHEATLEALALAIDAKDKDSRTHMRRLQAFCVTLARAEGLPDEEVQAIKTAALLHDIGMLAVPQHILSKTARLSEEERRKLRIHPQVGAEIIRDVPFPSPVAPIILAHHERWDGGGYPAGLKWEAIPLGARILAIADQFDELLSSRDIGGFDEAVCILRGEAGHALDPHLVTRFISLLPKLNDVIASGAPTALELAESAGGEGVKSADSTPWTTAAEQGKRPEQNQPVTLPSAGALPTPALNPFDNIALAHLEVYTLYELAQALSGCLSIQDTMAQLIAHLGKLVPLNTCALFLQDDNRHQVVCRFATGPGAPILQPMRVPTGAGPIGWVVEHERPLVNVSLSVTVPSSSSTSSSSTSSSVPAASTDAGEGGAGPVGRADLDSELRWAMIVPLLGDGICLGTLVVAHGDHGAYHDDHRRILEQVAQHVAVAIQNSLRFERTHEAALTDRLTSLTNSRGLATAFDNAMGQAVAQSESLAVLMLDIDEFKAINDLYGHAAGDRALREVARVLSQSIRAKDICARYAGDEFVLVLRGCGGPEAERRARSIQAMFEAVRFSPEPSRLQTLQISVGAAAYPADGASLETLLVIADRRMYRDKSLRKRARVRIGGDTDTPLSS
jgi:diguanylate cyclase (GGDEF)-like protein/putative nucleotidyltransferase with HDIG domain